MGERGRSMPGLFHQGREYLSAGDVERIYRITDSLDLPRDWVIVPLDVIPIPVELIQPDGKLLIHPPEQGAFESWMEGLASRLSTLDLGRCPRRSEEDPKASLTGPGEIRAVGTRGYLGTLGVLR
jgi:hypothetical protein